jgi:hypothetical protein
MELDLQSLFGLHVHSCTETPQTPIYEVAIDQPRKTTYLCDPLPPPKKFFLELPTFGSSYTPKIKIISKDDPIPPILLS